MIFSYSLISCFHDVCPRQAYERWWNKLKGPESTEMKAGFADHAALEKRLKYGHELPPHLDKCEPIVEALLTPRANATGIPLTERKMGVDRQCNFTGFFDNDCYIRSVADVMNYARDNISVFIGDWKTGKPKEDKEPLQHMILAATAFAEYPEMQHVSAANIYTKTGLLGTVNTWQRSELPGLWRVIIPLVQEIEDAEQRKAFPERKGPLCAWCPVFKCQHNNNPQRG